MVVTLTAIETRPRGTPIIAASKYPRHVAHEQNRALPVHEGSARARHPAYSRGGAQLW